MVTAWAAFERQRGHLFPWMPVFFAVGIGAYFSATSEPAFLALFVLWTCLATGIFCAWLFGAFYAPLFLAIVCVSAGFLVAHHRAETVAAPKLDFRYYGQITGRIVAVDRSFSDKVRLTLDQVRLNRVAAYKLPTRVRISLHGPPDGFTAEPGAVIHTTGHLSPPDGPVEPGGFDFQRHAWFQGLGAVGYTRKQVIVLERPDHAEPWLRLYQLRMHISAHVQSAMPGETGGVAAAIMVGDRSGIPLPVVTDLRASNLAHLLAISGLHMGLLAGFVFMGLRTLLVLHPRWALYVPVKKLAAAGALVAAFLYLLLSGMSVATERAFVMVCVMLVAILVNRRAISLRSVALAALIVLAARPEMLMGPGFQMSFAATTALVAVFGVLQKLELPRLPVVLRPLGAAFISSAVAGAATAPIAAAHFNQIAQLGLIANLLSVPLMGLLVMPAAVVAACLAPLGLGWVGLTVMHWGLLWILGVSHWIASLDQALSFVVTPGPLVLPCLMAGAVLIILWQGRLRWVGVMPAAFALFLWIETERPFALVAASGALIGVMTDDGRALSKSKGQGFAARSWLENDGDAAEQWQANRRGPPAVQQGVWEMALGAGALRHLTGKTGLAAFETCEAGDLVILSSRADIDAPCRVYDPVTLRKTGSLAIYPAPSFGGFRIVTARDVTGDRLWNMPNRQTYRARWINRSE